MGTAQWPQEIMVKPIEEIVGNTCPKPASSFDRKARGAPEKEAAAGLALKCPRCNSNNTKFCYYNNYSLTQPRYFCKTCKRYWTEGGSLRNIPVGGASRKNKRSSSSISKKLININPHDLVTNTPPSLLTQNPKIIPDAAPTSQLSALELLTAGISSSSRGFNSLFPMPVSDPNSVYTTSGFPMQMQEFKPTLNFSLDGLGINNGNSLQETTNGRLLFPFEDLKHTADHNEQEDDHSAGYWTGMLGGGASW